MSSKVGIWHDHPKLGKVKLHGAVNDGVAVLYQIYSNGVPMLFFEERDRNRPCGFSRIEIKIYEGMLLAAFESKHSKSKNSIKNFVTEKVERQERPRDFEGIRKLLNL